jgi:uncharacterized Zn finger protein
MVTSWQSMCPMCGESAFVGLGYPHYHYTLHCETCGTIWTMTELEVYELSFPDAETICIVNKLMKLSCEMAKEGDPK